MSSSARITATQIATLRALAGSSAVASDESEAIHAALGDLEAGCTTGKDSGPWRCFHCDEVFSDHESAALHFGTSEHQAPACTIDVAEYRAMEQRMHRYNEEDSDLHREIYGMQARHQAALRSEEERGYARGLEDGRLDATKGTGEAMVPPEIGALAAVPKHPDTRAKTADIALDNIKRFAGLVLKDHRNDGYPGDLDGGMIQNYAQQCGLLEERQMAEPCSDSCTCVEVADFPTSCFFYTELGRGLIELTRVGEQR